MLTILSQNTSDRNGILAYARMRERFPTWEDVRDAPEAELFEALRPGGLAVQKAPRIQAVLRDLDQLDLEWLGVACPPTRRCAGSSRSRASAPRRPRASCSSAWACR